MTASSLVSLAKELRKSTGDLTFDGVAYVYEPLTYAWPVAEKYLARFGASPKEVVFVGMNPGPFGMGQTGVPFGEISFVRDWMKLDGKVLRPTREHPKRPILGFDCTRSEVSGKRLWSAFAKKYKTADAFFDHAFVLNYCPLLFLGETGANLTPDKLQKDDRKKLEEICDEHLARALKATKAEYAIGVGQYAAKKIESLGLAGVSIGSIPHPSPASPTANKDWEGSAKKALASLGLSKFLS